MLSTTTKKGKTFPLELKELPINKIKGDAQFGSFFDIDNIIFFNFHPQCEIDSYAIHSNLISVDYFSIHNFDRVKFKNIFMDNLIKIEEIHSKGLVKNCGNFPCSGLKNVIVKLKNLIETRNEPIDIPQIKTTNSKLLEYKTSSNENTNSIYCSSDIQPAHLIFENIEPEARTRALHPVYVVSEDFEYKNKLNSFADHDCVFGYDSLRRTPRFPSMILMKKNMINKYNIYFTSTNPSKMKMQLIDADWKDNIKPSEIENNQQINKYVVKIKIRYQSSQTVIVSKNNQEIKADTFTDMEDSNHLNMNYSNENMCGKNIWNTFENSLNIYITNEPDCILFIDVIDSIKIYMRYDVDEKDFYDTDSQYTLMAKIAALLGIDISQVKLASIVKGSTIVNFDILQYTPSEIIEKDIFNNTAIDTSKSLLEIAIDIDDIIGSGGINLDYHVLNSKVIMNNHRALKAIDIPTTITYEEPTKNNTINNPTESYTINNPTESNTINNPTESYTINNSTENSKNDTINHSNTNNYFSYYIYCSIILIIIIALLVFIVVYKIKRIKREKDNIENNNSKDIQKNNLIKNESNTGVNNLNITSEFSLELKNKK